jgi:hypothetical protein
MSPPSVFAPDAIAVLTAAYEKAVREQAGSLYETIAKTHHRAGVRGRTRSRPAMPRGACAVDA